MELLPSNMTEAGSKSELLLATERKNTPEIKPYLYSSGSKAKRTELAATELQK